MFRNVTGAECAESFSDLIDDVDRGALTGEFAEWTAWLMREALREVVLGLVRRRHGIHPTVGLRAQPRSVRPTTSGRGATTGWCPTHTASGWRAASRPRSRTCSTTRAASRSQSPGRRHPGCAGRHRGADGQPRGSFAELVVAALDSLPEVFRERLGGVAIVVEDEASPELAAVGPGARRVRPLPGRAADVVGGGPQPISEQDPRSSGDRCCAPREPRTISPDEWPRPSTTKSPTISGSRTGGFATATTTPAAETVPGARRQ